MKTLKKNLGLFDVYAISTGAMFSSGFFLLPGIAAAQTGPSVVLAYFLAGLMIVPPMLNLAELSTAMPRAGGSYYFVDRALGPLFGTVAGLGTWVALVLKSAFALIGMGAYLAFFFDVPIVPLALALTVVFCVLNLYGSKKSGDLQRWLVTALVGILSYFVVEGVLASVGSPYAEAGWRSFESFAIEGFDGVIATAGLVFVSYAGLTGVTGVAEEVERPDRNIPLGMILSLMTATVIYCLGVYVMSATLEPSVFYGDMTPVATSSQAFMEWLPASIGLMLVVVSAIAAFASTGNAGILSASRYPLAMARDNLVPAVFTKISAHGTPARAIILTGAVIALCLVTFDVTAVAKLASAFQLLLFAMVGVTVIVMHESRLEFYQPGFNAPFYPFTQIAGIVIPLWLIWSMGWLAVGFSAGVVIIGAVGFLLYGAKRVKRRGAIRHVFERLGRERHHELDHELRRVVSDKGLRREDEFEPVLDDALWLRLKGPVAFDDVVWQASSMLSTRLNLDAKELADCFLEETRIGMIPIEDEGAVPHHLYHGVNTHQMLLVHVESGVPLHLDQETAHVVHDGLIYNFAFLLSPDDQAARHYRFVAEMASRLDKLPEMVTDTGDVSAEVIPESDDAERVDDEEAARDGTVE